MVMPASEMWQAGDDDVAMARRIKSLARWGESGQEPAQRDDLRSPQELAPSSIDRHTRLLTDMSIKKAAQSSLTPQALYGRASNAGPPRDTCRPGPNPKPPNRPLTCVFSRGAGRT
jgi:hypothetical protein